MKKITNTTSNIVFMPLGNVNHELDNAELAQEYLTNSLLSYSFSKEINQPAKWSALFKNTIDVSNLIYSDDWIALYSNPKAPIDTNSSYRKDLKILGTVDRVGQIKQIDAKGTITYFWKVSGRDFGKVFQNCVIFLNPYLVGNIEEDMVNLHINAPTGDAHGLSPSTYVQYYFDKTLYQKPQLTPSQNQWLFTPGVPPLVWDRFQLTNKEIGGIYLGNVIRSQIEPTVGNSVVGIGNHVNDTNLLDRIKYVANFPFNEIIFDIVDGIPTFIFRPVYRGMTGETAEILVLDSNDYDDEDIQANYTPSVENEEDLVKSWKQSDINKFSKAKI
jgi:hypothetical protein